MNRLMTALLLVGAALMTGCASKPQLPVSMNSSAVLNPQVRVGVAMTAVPKIDTYLPGASCLLCYAVASVANSSLTTHARTLSADDLLVVKTEMAAALKKKGVQVVMIDEALNLEKFPELTREVNRAGRDFSTLRDRYKIDKLLVIHVDGLGFQRNYSAYVPTSDPRAWVHGSGYVVDLTSHAYDWWQPIEVLRAANGKWDEGPKFPGLTNAYYQAIETAKDQLLSPVQR